jgi:sensor histidine kinase YesM
LVIRCFHSLILIFILGSLVGQDTLRVYQSMHQKMSTFPIVVDDDLDHFEAYQALSKNEIPPYKDKGRAFRSYDDYWTGGVIVNNEQEVFPLMIEGLFEEVYIDGNPISFCVLDLCEDTTGLIVQPQQKVAYTDLGFGSHVFVAKLGGYNLKKDFKPVFSDRSTFEGLENKDNRFPLLFTLFLCGVFFVLSLMSLLIYLAINEKTFLYYSLFCIGILIYTFRKVGEINEAYFVIDSVLPWVYCKMLWFFILFATYLKFSSAFINAKEKYPKINTASDTVVKVILIAFIPEFILLALGYYKESYTFYYLLRVGVSFYCLYILVALYKHKKDHFVKFLLVGGGALLLSEIITSLFYNNFATVVGLIGLMMDFLVFSAAIAYKLYFDFYRRLLLENENTNNQLMIEKLERDKMKLNVNTLQAQFNPHFIFNSMNSIKEFIITNQSEKASGYLAKFATLMRKVLDYSSKESITLEKELNITKEYLTFFQMMSEDEVSVEIDLADDVEEDLILVPPLIIQPYVENIFKHAFTKDIKDRKIRIRVHEKGEALIIEVIDNGIGFQNKKSYIDGHESKGMDINKERIITWCRLYNKTSTVECLSLTKDNAVSGSMVRITI